MKYISLSIITIISLFFCETISKECHVYDLVAYCDTIEVPNEISQSEGSLRIVNAFKGTSLPQYLFRNSTLINIRIEAGEIKVIRENTFVDLSTTFLSLMSNGVETIQPGAFKNLTQLEELRLDYNKLQLIEAGTFTKLPMSMLTLSHNLIATIEDSALSDLPKLIGLYLDKNKIESIFISKIMDDPSGLRYLDLHDNSLTTLTNDTLKGLTNLETLNVDSNKIATIGQGTLEQTPKLDFLYLRKNIIREIDINVFPQGGLSSLEEIYLSVNELMYLPSDFFDRLNHLKRIGLAGNPWLCSCLDNIWTIIKNNRIKEDSTGMWSKRWGSCIRTESKCLYKYNEELRASLP